MQGQANKVTWGPAGVWLTCVPEQACCHFQIQSSHAQTLLLSLKQTASPSQSLIRYGRSSTTCFVFEDPQRPSCTKLYLQNACLLLSQLQSLHNMVTETICADARRCSRDLDFLLLTTLDSVNTAAQVVSPRTVGIMCADTVQSVFGTVLVWPHSLLRSALLQTSVYPSERCM